MDAEPVESLIESLTRYTANTLYPPSDSEIVADHWQIQSGLECSDGHADLEILFCGEDQDNLASLGVGVLAILMGVVWRRRRVHGGGVGKESREF